MKEARRRKYVLEHLTLSQYPFLTPRLASHQKQTKKRAFQGNSLCAVVHQRCFFVFNWGIIDLQCCVSSRCTAK